MTTELSCSRCKVVKPIEAFRIRRNRSQNGKRLGRWSWCKACEAESFKTPKRREQIRLRTKKYRDNLKKTNLQEVRRKERECNIRRKYGISISEYDELVKGQNGVCAICNNHPTNSCGKKLHIDHCHTTGKIRGLLCGQCNTALGSFKDDINVIRNAINYLVKNACSNEFDILYHPEIIGCLTLAQPAGS